MGYHDGTIAFDAFLRPQKAFVTVIYTDLSHFCEFNENPLNNPLSELSGPYIFRFI